MHNARHCHVLTVTTQSVNSIIWNDEGFVEKFLIIRREIHLYDNA